VNYRWLAKAVNVFHWIWVGVLLTSLILPIGFPWMRPFTIAVIIVTGFSQVIWCRCPLGLLEESLRAKAGDTPTRAPFLVNALRRHFGINVPPWVIAAQMAVLMIFALYLLFAGHLDIPPH
jgi:hypothetical protein